MIVNNNTDEHPNVNLAAASMSDDHEMVVDDHCIPDFDINAVESNTVFHSILDANNSQVTYKDV